MAKLNIESYPPLFRQVHDPDPNESPTENKGNSMDPLPLIDMQCLDLQKLDKACREWGIFRLVNHGIPTKLLEELHEYAKLIFDLPFEYKQGLANNTSTMKYFWGTPALTPAGEAIPRAGPAQNMDYVEGFNVPLSQLSSNMQLPTSDYDDDDHLIDAFRKLLEDYNKEHLNRLASTLFDAIARSLNVNKEIQIPRTCLDESTGLVRVYRYPRQHSRMVEHVKGMHVHTDSSVFSILHQYEVGGLQFFKDNNWFDIEPITCTLVVNLGDMMQAISNDEYKSVKHRVKLNKHKERTSVCYFVFPEMNSLIESSKYRPFTYNDFRAQVQQDVKTLGWKIGLESFRSPQPQSS